MSSTTTSNTNPLLAIFAPAIEKVLQQVITAATSISANPTVENVVAQGETLALEAVSPAQLEGLSIGGLAQEVANLATGLQSHLASAAAAPSPLVPQNAVVPASAA